MSTFVSALDSFAGISQFGENGFPEHRWDPDIQNQILQFFFQLVRCDSERVDELGVILHGILVNLVHPRKYMEEERKRVECISLLFRMIGHTRDIIHGKGEYALSYMMIWTWYQSFPDLALYALTTFVTPFTNEFPIDSHPYGSWKDMKYFANYCALRGADMDHPIIRLCVHLTNTQIIDDLEKWNHYSGSETNENSISLCAKWVPRENSQFSWFFKELAKECYGRYGYFETALSKDSYNRALKKSYTYYRKTLSILNRFLDTVQIHQCGKEWRNINPHNVTSITLSKQKKAFLNIDKKGEQRTDKLDRIQCAEHFTHYIESRVKSGQTIKGKRVGLPDMTKQALDLLSNHGSDIERDLLNAQWKDNASQNGSLEKMIAIVDTSGSMEGDPLFSAIALGIRIAEKSLLGKRVITFSNKPEWHNLDGCDDFVSMVGCLRNAKWGMNTNFEAVLMMILKALIEKKVSPEEASGITLTILSDMQIDKSSDENITSMYDLISTSYRAFGYEPPHILFWNLRSTDGFPCLATQDNVSMMSGFSPALLNAFCEKGIDALKSATPWNTMVELLLNERYDPLAKMAETNV